MTKSPNKMEGFSAYKRFAVKAAKELLYSDDIVKQINESKTQGEIERILQYARSEED